MAKTDETLNLHEYHEIFQIAVASLPSAQRANIHKMHQRLMQNGGIGEMVASEIAVKVGLFVEANVPRALVQP